MKDKEMDFSCPSFNSREDWGQTIELNEEAKEKPKGGFFRAFRYPVIIVSLVVVFSIVSFAYTALLRNIINVAYAKYLDYRYEFHEYLISSYQVNDPKGLTVDGDSLKMAVNTYSQKYKLNPMIAWVIIDRESNGRPDRIRFEKGWKSKYSSEWKKEPWMTDAEYDMLFSSIGIMQIGYGLHRERCGLRSYADLLSIDKSLDCGLKIFSGCLERNTSIKSKGGRLRRCFMEYNGSGSQAEKYATICMSKLADFMIEDVKDFIPEEVKSEIDNMD